MSVVKTDVCRRLLAYADSEIHYGTVSSINTQIAQSPYSSILSPGTTCNAAVG
jgi:hypothetical protein